MQGKPFATMGALVEKHQEGKGVKRLTFDITVSRCRQIKMQRAACGTKIVEEIRESLTREYGDA